MFMRGDDMELYKRIRQRREELKMTQDELANLMGYKSRSSINKIELGKSDIPQSKIKAFAAALKTTPEFLMGLNENEQIQYIYNNVKQNTMLEIYSTLGYDSYKLLKIYDQLPKEQQVSMIDNAEFLAKRYIGDDFHIESEGEMDNYLFKSFDMLSMEEIENSDEYQSYLEYEKELDAAHSKKDATPEENKQDNNIMNDDNEWK